MANANSTSSRTSKRNADQGQSGQSHDLGSEQEIPGLDDPGPALPELHEWFDAEALGEHHDWLRTTGSSLNRAMNALVCIGVLVDMVRSSKQGKERCLPHLTNPQEHAMLDAISIISDSVNEQIVETSAYLNAKLQEGGAA